jgi:ankyrin repeat protein
MKSVVEYNDRTMLLIAEPGMGKSTFLSYMAHEIKKLNPLVWVLRINLNEHTKELKDIEFGKECIDKYKMFLWSAAHSPEQEGLKVKKKIFFQMLEQTDNMVIILDGFDEISPHYNDKVKMLIKAIRDKTASKIRISSRFLYQQELEEIVGKFAFTLQPFTSENQIQFLEQYWSEVTEISNKENLQIFAKQLLSLCSKNFSDKDGEFTGIPLQTMMLGEIFINEAKEYCCSEEFNIPEKFKLLFLFKKFTEKKFDIYLIEKNKVGTSNLEVKSDQKDYVEKHMISALLYLLSTNEFKGLCGAINSSDLDQAKRFMRGVKAQKLGIITKNADRKPHFIHRCFAEYFAAKWFVDNFRNCEESFSNLLFNSTYEGTRNIFDQILAEDAEIHGSVLNNDIHVLKEILNKITDINLPDKGGRTALHLAASYNRPYIKQLLSFPGIDANKQDEVLKWTPIRYADRMKSWMVMDILLQNGANPNDIVFTRHNAKEQEWGQTALWECASEGYIQLLEFMLNCGIDMNERVGVPENLHAKRTLLHRAIICDQVEVVIFLVKKGAGIKIRDAKKNTALHLAAESGSVDIINILLDKGMCVNVIDKDGFSPLHVSAECGNLEATKTLVSRGAAINNTNIDGGTPLMVAAYNGRLEVFRYLTEMGADINICDDDNNTALHLASVSGCVDIIRLVLDKGMSVNLIDTDSSTPLHISAECGHLEATKTLVEKGADMNSTNIDGHTPLLVAAYEGNFEICRYLTENGADINIRDDDSNTALHFAGVSGSVDIINLLLDKGMSVNLIDRDNSIPLHVAAEFGHLEATKTLVERGADINNINTHGNTPLMIAAYNGKLEVFRYLTEICADITITDYDKNTALHLAAESGSVDIIKLLLDKSMSVNLTNTDDSTPLHVCAQFGHMEATKTLVEKGATINYTNREGKTALMVAEYNGRLEVVRYLTEIVAGTNFLEA